MKRRFLTAPLPATGAWSCDRMCRGACAVTASGHASPRRTCGFTANVLDSEEDAYGLRQDRYDM